jgi:hypothetical protein
MLNRKVRYREIPLWKYLVNTMFVGLFMAGVMVIILIEGFDLYLTPISINKISMTKSQVMDIINQTLMNISESHDYIRGVYDCSQYSHDLVDSLKEQGISAYCVTGIVEIDNKSYGHVWVEVIIEDKLFVLESTSGKITNNETKAIYKPLRKGICV